MRHYCTYFDHNYLARGLALLQSLRRQSSEPFHLWVLALNPECERLLQLLHPLDVTVLTLGELEEAFPELLTVKTQRKTIEYYFTCSPALPLFLMLRNPEISQISYVDADMYFFGNPKRIFEQIGTASIAITPHRFPDYLRHLEGCGKFNVGWLTFRRDEQGLACLRRWHEQCVEWCFDRMEEGKFGDQAYLDEWPERYSNLCILTHPGVNTAIWNIGQARWALQNGVVHVNGHPLLVYHFHGLKAIAPRVYDSTMRHFHVPHSALVNEHIYAPYLQSWISEHAALRSLLKEEPSGYLRNASASRSLLRDGCAWISSRAAFVFGKSWADRMRCALDWMSAHVEAAFGQHFIVTETRILRLPWRV